MNVYLVTNDEGEVLGAFLDAAIAGEALDSLPYPGVVSCVPLYSAAEDME